MDLVVKNLQIVNAKYRIYCNKRPGAYKNFPISGGGPIREGRLKERGGYIYLFYLFILYLELVTIRI